MMDFDDFEEVFDTQFWVQLKQKCLAASNHCSFENDMKIIFLEIVPKLDIIRKMVETGEI